MINQVLPAIRAKWPREDVGKPIFIQQDNAPSHLKLDDPDFCEAAKIGGFDIRLICQPPNSPDFNILDLGFFRAIQAIQYKKNAKTIEALVPAVQEVICSNGSHMFQCSLSQQICSLIHFLHTCFVGIHGVLGTQSKPNISNTTRCSDGSYEEERLQQLQDTSHEKRNIGKRRSSANFHPL
jgi:hypothetical protein